jgi:membrane protein DedA with SNARE-associated domain
MSAPVLPGFLGSLAPLLSHYGYWAVAGLVLVEDFGVPAPGETVLIAAAIYAGAGQLNVVVVGVVGLAAAVIGDNIGYAIGHVGGRHGGKVVTVARFVEGLRQANGIIAGITGMPWRRFLVFNALGAALWVGLWVTLGDLAGSHITAIYDTARRYELYLAIAVAVVLVAVIGRYLARRRGGRSTTLREHRSD